MVKSEIEFQNNPLQKLQKIVSAKYQPPRIEDYEPLVGPETIGCILKKAEVLKGFHIANINSTYNGGGVAELLSPLTLLLNGLGIQAGWRLLQGTPDFFGITKRMQQDFDYLV
jgi:trehalose synthase